MEYAISTHKEKQEDQEEVQNENPNPDMNIEEEDNYEEKIKVPKNFHFPEIVYRKDEKEAKRRDRELREKEEKEMKERQDKLNTELSKLKPTKKEEDISLDSTSTNNIDLSSNEIKSQNQSELYFETSLDQNSQGLLFKRIGNSYAFFFNSMGNPLLIIGPRWPTIIIFSLLIIGIYIAYFNILKANYNMMYKLIGVFLLLCFEGTYIFTAIINQGYPKNDLNRQNGESRDDSRYCSECCFYVSEKKNVSHCNNCGICVEGFNHHSLLVGKCIGKNNKYTFYAIIVFLIMIFIYLILGFMSFTRK